MCTLQPSPCSLQLGRGHRVIALRLDLFLFLGSGRILEHAGCCCFIRQSSSPCCYQLALTDIASHDNQWPMDSKKKSSTTMLKLQLISKRNREINATIARVSAGSDKHPPVGCEWKTTRIVICTVFIFEIKGPVVYLTLGTNTTERSQKSVKSLVLIYQQLWYFFLRRKRNEPCFRPASPFFSLNWRIILLAYRAFIPHTTSLCLFTR